MSNLEDEKAQTSLENTKHFQAFAMLLNDAGNIEIFV